MTLDDTCTGKTLDAQFAALVPYLGKALTNSCSSKSLLTFLWKLALCEERIMTPSGIVQRGRAIREKVSSELLNISHPELQSHICSLKSRLANDDKHKCPSGNEKRVYSIRGSSLEEQMVDLIPEIVVSLTDSHPQSILKILGHLSSFQEDMIETCGVSHEYGCLTRKAAVVTLGESGFPEALPYLNRAKEDRGDLAGGGYDLTYDVVGGSEIADIAKGYLEQLDSRNSVAVPSYEGEPLQHKTKKNLIVCHASMFYKDILAFAEKFLNNAGRRMRPCLMNRIGNHARKCKVITPSERYARISM